MFSPSASSALPRRICAFAVFIASGCLFARSAFANGIPEPWGIAMQTPASPVQDYIDRYHDILLWLIGAISLFVLALMLYVIARYNKWANPTPSKTAHNITLEIIWTLVPTIILLVIFFVWSMPLLYYSDRAPANPDLTLKVTGHQWYWSYEYPDNNDISFDSHAIWDSSAVTDKDAAKLIADSSSGWLVKTTPLRLLEVDNRVVLPVGKIVRVQITSTDVEHSWYLPSLGINRMAVPGRLNEVWLKLDRPGIYYGQCSMICGNGHGYMPIVVEGVSPQKFAAWAATKKNAAGEGIYLPAPHYAALQKTDNEGQQ